MPTADVAAIPITRYPMSMTGKKLRARLGIEERIYGTEDFKVKHKFLCIPKLMRLGFLIRKANAETGVFVSFAEQVQKRRQFDRNKLRTFPMTKDCPCYSCWDGVARIRHHVVPISKGGSNKRNNIVPLCNTCHKKIHPNMRVGLKFGNQG